MGKVPHSPETASASIEHVLMTVAVRLKDARQRRKMTQKQVAELSGLQHSYVYEIETGKTNITLRTLAKLAEVLQTDIRALLPETAPGLASAGDGTILSGVLDKTVWVLQEWEKQDAERHRQDAERHKRQSALLEELKSVAGLGKHVEPQTMSVEELAPAKEPRPEADTIRGKRTGSPPGSH
jgi:transcriptional regulator with XRE-family HTH domain